MKPNHNLICEICNNNLKGRQTKFCSIKCKLKSCNNKHQNYNNQQRRGAARKIKLMQIKGLRCEICGYGKNYAALAFHHRNPDNKSFGLDLRSCSNNSWKSLVAEADKCDLVCMNCHMEIHHPDFEAVSSRNKMNEFIEFNNNEVNQHLLEFMICKSCGKEYQPDNRERKYCSENCYRLHSRKVDRPSIEQLQNDLLKMSYVKVGNKYGVSDNAIRKWLKIN